MTCKVTCKRKCYSIEAEQNRTTGNRAAYLSCSAAFRLLLGSGIMFICKRCHLICLQQVLNCLDLPADGKYILCASACGCLHRQVWLMHFPKLTRCKQLCCCLIRACLSAAKDSAIGPVQEARPWSDRSRTFNACLISSHCLTAAASTPSSACTAKHTGRQRLLACTCPGIEGQS